MADNISLLSFINQDYVLLLWSRCLHPIKQSFYQSKTLDSLGLLFNLCCAAHDLTSCNCRTPQKGRLTTAVMMTHGICWPPDTIPSSAISAPERWILPFSPAGTNTKKVQSKWYQVGVFLETLTELFSWSRPIFSIVFAFNLWLLSCCVFVVVFRAVWVNTLIAC